MARFTLSSSIIDTLKDWQIKLKNLSFADNFRGYETEVIEIDAGKEYRITHNLKLIPTRFILTDMQGVGTIVKGDTRATEQFFYVKNTASTTTFKGRILVMP